MHKTVKSHLVSFIGDFGDCIGGGFIGYGVGTMLSSYVATGMAFIVVSIIIRKYKN